MKNKTIKNAGWLIAGKVIQMLISLFVGIITARYLGPSNYGLINYAASYTAFFMAFCTLGINSILVKEFVDHPDAEGEIIGSSLLMRGVSSLLSAIMIICIVGMVDAGETITIVVTALSSLGLVFHIFEVFNYWFQSKLKSKFTAFATLVAYILTSIYKIVLLIAGKSVEWFAFATSFDYICLAILLFAFYKKCDGPKLSVSIATCKRMLRKSVHFILSSLMVAIYGYTDKFMLKQMISEAEVGYYSTATTICAMWCFVLSAIIDSVYPSIMAAYNSDKDLFDQRNRQLYCIVFYVSMVVSVLFCLLGELVIQILYGTAYLPAVAPLRIVTWYTAFSYLGAARNAWIVCESKQKYLKYIYFSAAAGNVIMNLLLIPSMGAIGASLASLITQIITVLVIPFLIKPLRENSILMIEAIMFKGVREKKMLK